MKIVSFKQKKVKLLTNQQQKSNENVKNYYVCKEKIKNKYVKDKNYLRLRYNCHYTEEYSGVAHSVYNYNIVYLKKFP